ncbi:Hypothetical predicted protein [Olea europaea subsp. europaea]|uniref:Uncharacterized protein n=1 Tax=Olea europaea subsp. europaea TaxID=158383 RepID=A0A8S0Q077_OLEEU|nr:Hypothetical predicted protein [Olea europaea subsp. europaea]
MAPLLRISPSAAPNTFKQILEGVNRKWQTKLQRSKEIIEINRTTVTSWTPTAAALSSTLEEEKDENGTEKRDGALIAS